MRSYGLRKEDRGTVINTGKNKNNQDVLKS